MSFAGMNYLAIVVAAVAAWIFGAVYYAGLGTRWMKAARIDPSAPRWAPACSSPASSAN